MLSASTPHNQERREQARAETLGFLADRQAVAQHPADIRRRLNAGHEWDFTLEEIQAACVYLVSAGFAKELPHPHGATRYYQATSEGVLAHERRTA